MNGLTALIPLDGSRLSETALEMLPFVKGLGVERVRLLSVWRALESSTNLADEIEQEEAERGQNLLRAYLDQRAEQVRNSGLEVDIDVRLGRAAEQIVNAAEHDTDLVIIATHGRDGIERFRLGSVADKVIRHAPCPALVIGPNVRINSEAFRPSRILAPVDGSPDSDLMLRVSVWIARHSGSELHIVRVVSPATAAPEPTIGVYAPETLTMVIDAANSTVEGLAQKLGDQVTVKTEVRIGPAASELIDYAEKNQCELVVMAAHGHAGIFRAILGSVTDRMLHGPAPVLVWHSESEIRSRLILQATGGKAGERAN